MNETWCSNKSECKIFNRTKKVCKKTCGFYFDMGTVPKIFKTSGLPLTALNVDISEMCKTIKIEMAYYDDSFDKMLLFHTRLQKSCAENRTVKNITFEFE